jgi:hypothetical protein
VISPCTLQCVIRRLPHVRFVPKANLTQRGKKSSFDHIVGALLLLQGHIETQRLRNFELALQRRYHALASVLNGSRCRLSIESPPVAGSSTTHSGNGVT